MAEFSEVMQQVKRMCKAHAVCEKCAMNVTTDKLNKLCACFSTFNEVPAEVIEIVESIVMQWVAEHPEQKYPSWNDAWKQLFPDAHEKESPCPKFMLDYDRSKSLCSSHISCDQCLKSEIPADIAEKLGIKPIGDADNG